MKDAYLENMRKNFPLKKKLQEKKKKKKNPLELIHTNVCNPIHPNSLGKKLGFIF